jgi:SdrD B-like protein
VKQLTIILVLLGMTAILAGCSDDPVVPGETNNLGSTTGVGTIADSYSDFTLKMDAADSPLGILQGPFHLKGQNLRYDEEAMALLVDFTITNAGIVAHPEPVEVTFLHFVPDTVTVLNAPGADATFPFEFANDDGMWTPGEESFPLTVMFGAPYGLSFAFGAHISLGYGSQSGVISGFVWHDMDSDGVWDDNEPGMPGIDVILEGDFTEPVKAEIDVRITQTGPLGEYAFGGLNAGHFVVGIEPMDGREITTPSDMHVILVEDSQGVGSFTDAVFGMRPLVGPVYVLMPAAADATIRADLGSRANDNYGADPFLAVGGTRTPDGILTKNLIFT